MFEDYLEENKKNSLKELNDCLRKLELEIKKDNEASFKLIKINVDFQLTFIELVFPYMNFKNNDFTSIILSLCYNNLITLLSIVDLIEKGLLGPAKILFRNIYESLLIGKLIGTTKNYDYYNRWYNGKQFSMKKDVFSKITLEPSNESLKFWDILNKYTHSTIFSYGELQINKEEINHLIVIIKTLLCMNFHLLNSFILSEYRYYLTTYMGNYYIKRKVAIKEIIKTYKKNIDKRCKKVLYDYCHKWILK